MGFEKRRRTLKNYQAVPNDRSETEQDLRALHMAKKIEKDPERHKRAKNLAREKLNDRRTRGKAQANVKRVDNTMKEAIHG